MNNKFIEEHSLDYVDFIRNKQCCVSGNHVADPHHLHAIGMGANRQKPNARHFTCVPLSRDMHTELHQIGMNRFQEKYKIDLWQEAYYYFINFLMQRGILDDQNYQDKND